MYTLLMEEESGPEAKRQRRMQRTLEEVARITGACTNLLQCCNKLEQKNGELEQEMQEASESNLRAEKELTKVREELTKVREELAEAREELKTLKSKRGEVEGDSGEPTTQQLEYHLREELQKLHNNKIIDAGLLKGLFIHIDQNLALLENDKDEAKFKMPDDSLVKCIKDLQEGRISIVPYSFNSGKTGVTTLLCGFLNQSYDSTDINCMDKTTYLEGTNGLIRGFWRRLLEILEPKGACNNKKDKVKAQSCVKVLREFGCFPVNAHSTGIFSILYGMDYRR